MVDEYTAARVAGGDWPAGLPDGELGLTAARHWRLFRAVHGGRGGQLDQQWARLSPAGRDGMRCPHPEVLQVLDPRPVLDEAAILAARFGGTGLRVAETRADGLTYGRQLWFGTPTNVGNLLRRARHCCPRRRCVNVAGSLALTWTTTMIGAAGTNRVDRPAVTL